MSDWKSSALLVREDFASLESSRDGRGIRRCRGLCGSWVFGNLGFIHIISFAMSNLSLGAFSVSLAVKDIHASLAFYEKLGFSAMGGNIDQKWLILKNGSTIIGLFEGMFEQNILTFNPGWDQDAQPFDPFDDVRKIQSELVASGLSLTQSTNPDGSGPGHITLLDPDGNAILIDQHR
jgi:catechol 2,3-dioxygenase-like lactoylglutathione lyase family enzyme